jgi:hypothetical protein
MPFASASGFDLSISADSPLTIQHNTFYFTLTPNDTLTGEDGSFDFSPSSYRGTLTFDATSTVNMTLTTNIWQVIINGVTLESGDYFIFENGASYTIQFWFIPLEEPWNPYIDPLSFLSQYLYRGDFIGFLTAIYTYAFGDVGFFYMMIAFIVGIVLYIRFKSVIICAILWITLGSFYVALVPMAANFAILLVVVAVGSLLFEVFVRHRRE